ncbi:MAG: NAD(P)H-hydrate dehydratase [Hespellia sp.]|nr:NAD(P)H-hydrate dehydratase [Hespellia sp.]
MRYLPNGSQMREGDLYTIEHIGIPSMVLMERAALATVHVMEEENVNLSDVLIVCGSGNNGGDGFAIARLLNERGRKVTVTFVGAEKSLSEQAREQMQILEHLEIPVLDAIPEKGYSAILDAVFGVGLGREIEGHYKDVVEELNRTEGYKVAVDIPSGIDAATGNILGTAFHADLTVSYAFEKMGTVLFPGAAYAGKVVPVVIGIPDQALAQYQNEIVYTYNTEDLKTILPERKANSHKGSYGRVLMITGSKGMSGAAYLSAKAAYVSGSGLVQIYTTEDNREILQRMLPEAIITTYTSFDKKQLAELLKWADVAAIGSGLGQSEISEDLLIETVKYCEVPLVIDADGLNLLAEHIGLLKHVLCDVILTPHMKEMSRLLGCSVKELQEKRFDLLKDFVTKYPVTCALKDARTFVMTANKAPYLNTSGNAAMAKAGSGDVLTGVTAAMLAQGKAPQEAGAAAVYLHGIAGDMARDKKGCYGVLARDLIAGIADICEEQEEIENGTV